MYRNADIGHTERHYIILINKREISDTENPESREIQKERCKAESELANIRCFLVKTRCINRFRTAGWGKDKISDSDVGTETGKVKVNENENTLTCSSFEQGVLFHLVLM